MQVEDANGNLVTGSSAAVTVAVTPSASGTLGGTLTVNAVNGVATFSGVTLSGLVGTTYTLTFSSGAYTVATVSNVTVTTAGAASKLAFATAPVGGASGGPLTTQPIVKVEDSAGNVVTTSSATITVTSSGSSIVGGSQAAGLNASAGVATFSNLTLAGLINTDYTLTFASGVLTPVVSGTLRVTAGLASKIAATSGAPTMQAGTAGASVGILPSVTVTDAGGNPVSGVSVIFAITGGGGSITGGTATTNAAGVATVASWTLGPLTGDNTLTATSGILSGSPVTFTATSIIVGTQYGGGVVGYILKSGDPGYVAGQTHGLIAATSDQSLGTVWALPAFQTILLGGTGTGLGTGAANTTAIVAQNGAGSSYAAGLADAYTNTNTGTGVYSDWYLPSKDELNTLWTNHVAVGGFSAAYYWTSSEGDAYDAMLQHFGNGSQAVFVKGLATPAVCVRAVRSF